MVILLLVSFFFTFALPLNAEGTVERWVNSNSDQFDPYYAAGHFLVPFQKQGVISDGVAQEIIFLFEKGTETQKAFALLCFRSILALTPKKRIEIEEQFLSYINQNFSPLRMLVFNEAINLGIRFGGRIKPVPGDSVGSLLSAVINENAAEERCKVISRLLIETDNRRISKGEKEKKANRFFDALSALQFVDITGIGRLLYEHGYFGLARSLLTAITENPVGFEPCRIKQAKRYLLRMKLGRIKTSDTSPKENPREEKFDALGSF